MRNSFFRLTGFVLCIASGVLISIIEFQFFSGSAHTLAIFSAILCATLLIVFIYFSSGNSAIFLMLYTIILTFILDFLEKSIDVRVLLLCQCCLGLLYAQSHFQANSQRFCTPNPAFGPYFLILLVCFCIVVFSSFLIFRFILEPLLPESEKFALFQQNEEEVEPPPEILENTATLDTARDDTGSAGPDFLLKALLRVLLTALVIAALALILWALTAYIHYRLWLRRTLSAPCERQISEFYRYILRALAVYGCPRQAQETPFEYLKALKSVDFPLSMEQFDSLSRAFVASSLGKKPVSAKDYDACLNLFRSISVNFREKMGLRGYVFRYLTKMHCRRFSAA